MKKTIIAIVMGIVVLSTITTVTFAHPGNTSWDGCHYCWTNCASWGYTYGTRHCRNGGTPKFGVADPLHYGSNTSPVYVPPVYTPPTPVCGTNSHATATGRCSCDTGHAWKYPDNPDNTDCVLKPTCGTNQYLGADGKCYCNTGYLEYSGVCVTYTESCQRMYGTNSWGNKDYCYCSVGYTMNSTKTACEKITCGTNQYLGADGKCDCSTGYEWDILRISCVAKKLSCGLNSHSTGDGKCSCDTGYVWKYLDDPTNYECVIPICGTNEYLGADNLCRCNTGYHWSIPANKCLTATESCQSIYGVNSYSYGEDSKGSYLCYCKDGYEWNTSRTSCISNGTCTETSWTPDTSTICKGVSFTQTGYACKGTRQALGTKDCSTPTTTFCGTNAYLVEDNKCYCNKGFTWVFPTDPPDTNCGKKMKTVRYYNGTLEYQSPYPTDSINHEVSLTVKIKNTSNKVWNTWDNWQNLPNKTLTGERVWVVKDGADTTAPQFIKKGEVGIFTIKFTSGSKGFFKQRIAPYSVNSKYAINIGDVFWNVTIE